LWLFGLLGLSIALFFFVTGLECEWVGLSVALFFVSESSLSLSNCANLKLVCETEGLSELFLTCHRGGALTGRLRDHHNTIFLNESYFCKQRSTSKLEEEIEINMKSKNLAAIKASDKK
jgi:hypothetical protein